MDHSFSADNKFEWYLFIDNRYRGPYSFEQIDSALRLGNLSVSTLTWKQGMSDWESIRELPELAASAVEAPPMPVGSGFPDGQLPGLDEPALADTIEFLEQVTVEPSTELDVSFPLVVSPDEAIRSPVSFLPGSIHQPMISRAYVGLGMLLITAVLSSGYYFYTTLFAFPRLPGVYGDELRDLERASKQSLISAGVAGHMVLVPGTAAEPRFYIASNLGAERPVEMIVEGIPDTLVDAFEFKTTLKIRLNGLVTKTPVVRQKDGQRLPMGEYNVRLVGDGQTITQRTVFLGGQRDASYESRLKMYHSTIKLQAEAELDEIRQLAETLESQLSEMRSGSRLTERWAGLQRQIETMFQGWTSEGLDKEFYYGSLYLLVRQSSEAIGKKEIAKAEQLIVSLRSKIALAERQGSNGSGLPRRLKD